MIETHLDGHSQDNPAAGVQRLPTAESIARSLGYELHELAKRLPPPPNSDVDYWLGRMEERPTPEVQKKAGLLPLQLKKWRGTVCVVDSADPAHPESLWGLAELQAWKKMGNGVDSIPVGCFRHVKPQHALWELLIQIGDQSAWTPDRRARAASFFVVEVKKRLSTFQAALGLTPGVGGETHTVLQKLCHVSARKIAHVTAAAPSRDRRSKKVKKTARIRAARQPQEASYNKPGISGLQTSREWTGWNSRFELRPVIQDQRELSEPLADLIVIEIERVHLVTRDVYKRCKPGGVVAFIYDKAERMADPAYADKEWKRVEKFDRNRLKTTFKYANPVQMLKSIDSSGRRSWYLIDLYTFGKRDIELMLVGDVDDKINRLLRHQELTGGKRECRKRLYEELFKSFCSRGGTALAVVCDELRHSASKLETAENNSVISCLSDAAKHSKTKVMVYQGLVKAPG